MAETDEVKKLLDDMIFTVTSHRANELARETAVKLVDECTHNDRANITMLIMTVIKIAAGVVAVVIRDNPEHMVGAVEYFADTLEAQMKAQMKRKKEGKSNGKA